VTEPTSSFEDRLWDRALTQYGTEFDEIESGHWWFAGRRSVILAALRHRLPSGSRLLDFGCGAGGLTAELARFYSVVGVDSAKPAIALARRRGLDARLVTDSAPLPGGFDAACALDVIEHLGDDVTAVRRLAEAVTEGGLVFLTVPAYPVLWGKMDEVAGHVRRYTMSAINRTVSAAGLRRVHASYFNSWLFPAVAIGRLAGFPRENHEIDQPPRAVNALLRAVFESEAPIAARFRIPFGVSILYIAAR
jgi:SAM-dependent methyltransferase